MNSIINSCSPCTPPSTVIFYTSYTKANGSLQHLEIIFDTATAATVTTILEVDPGTCPLLRRESIGRNHCRKNHCNWCASEKLHDKAALAPAQESAAPNVICPHPATKLNTIPNGGSLSASDTSNTASFASKTTAPVTDLAPFIPNATSKAASSNTFKPTTSAPNSNPPPERHHLIDPKELWFPGADTKTPLTKIMHSIVYLFFNKQTNYNWLRSCPKPFNLFQSYASRSQILATQNPNQKEGEYGRTPHHG